MSIKWQHYTTNNEVLERADLLSIEAMLMLRQLRWAGHVSRMEDSRIPKAVFYGELVEGKRNRGAPRKRFKDQLKKQLSQAGINCATWEQLAADRGSWRTTAHGGAQCFEDARREEMEEKRRRRKDAATQDPTGQIHTCPHCSRPCRSRIGLHSHQRACRPTLAGPSQR